MRYRRRCRALMPSRMSCAIFRQRCARNEMHHLRGGLARRRRSGNMPLLLNMLKRLITTVIAAKVVLAFALSAKAAETNLLRTFTALNVPRAGPTNGLPY